MAWGHRVTFTAYAQGDPDPDAIAKAVQDIDGRLDCSLVAITTDAVAVEPDVDEDAAA